MDNIFILGFISALALILLFYRIGIRKVLYFNIIIDVAGTALLGYLYMGTLTGMLTAAVGGVFLSIYLTIARKIHGTEKPTFNTLEK